MSVPEPSSTAELTRLALFTDSLEPSGVGRVMETLARHLSPHRYRLFLVCADHPGADGLAARMAPHVAEIVRFTVRGDEDLPALHQLVERLRDFRVEIFHNHIGATWEGDWGTIAARCAGVPVVVATEHLPCVLTLAHELEHRRRLNRLLDRIFAVSESVRQSLIVQRLAPADRVVTVENGVEPLLWTAGRMAARCELELPDDQQVILFLGRLVEQKDPMLLLQALHLLASQGERPWLLFAGDGHLRGDLDREVERLGLRQQVCRLGNRRDIARLLAAADVLAMPSRFEGLPLAALEAFAAGLPVVGCDAPGVRDVVAHRVNGWLAPIGDAEKLAQGMRLALAREPGRRPTVGSQWGSAARARYLQRFTAEQMAARHDRLYLQLRKAAHRSLLTAHRQGRCRPAGLTASHCLGGER